MSTCKSSEFPKSLHRGGAISKPQVLQDKGTCHPHEEGNYSLTETKATVVVHGRQRGRSGRPHGRPETTQSKGARALIPSAGQDAGQGGADGSCPTGGTTQDTSQVRAEAGGLCVFQGNLLRTRVHSRVVQISSEGNDVRRALVVTRQMQNHRL